MEGISTILEYLEKHISWRNVPVLILLVLAFLAGGYLRRQSRTSMRQN